MYHIWLYVLTNISDYTSTISICIIIYFNKNSKTYPRIVFFWEIAVSAYPYPSDTDTRIRIRAA
jgi:hypothetical protein